MLVEYVKRIPGHRNSKGEPAPWTIVSHKTGKVLSSHKTKREAEEHLKQMHVFKEGIGMEGFEEIERRYGNPRTADHDIYIDHSADLYYATKKDDVLGWAILNNDIGTLERLADGNSWVDEDGNFVDVSDDEAFDEGCREMNLDSAIDEYNENPCRLVGREDNEEAIRWIYAKRPDFIMPPADFDAMFYKGYGKDILRKAYWNFDSDEITNIASEENFEAWLYESVSRRGRILEEDADMCRRKSRFLFEGFFDANSVSDGCGGNFWVKDGKVIIDRYNHENGRNEIPIEDLDDASDILLELLLSRKANYIKTSRNALLSGDAMRDEYLEFIPDRSIKFYTARGIAVSNLIAADLEQKLKDGGFEVIRSQDWYSDVVRYIAYIAGLYVFKPCGEFKELRNLLDRAYHHLEPQKWFVSDVTGKRGEIFDERKHYFCEDGNMCSEVLDFVRNNRSSIRDWSLEKFEDLDDMERGIRYETEWSGHRGTHLVFKMKDGEAVLF